MSIRALRILVTPPSTSSSPPSLVYPSSSSTSTEASSSSTEINTIDAEEPRDVVSPLPPVPPKDYNVLRPSLQRRNRGATTATSTSIRSADDLLTQVDVLRDSANAARERRPRFRGNRTVHDRSNDDDSGNGTRTRRRDSRPSCGPKPSREAEFAQAQISARRANKPSVLAVSPVNPAASAGGPNVRDFWGLMGYLPND